MCLFSTTKRGVDQDLADPLLILNRWTPHAQSRRRGVGALARESAFKHHMSASSFTTALLQRNGVACFWCVEGEKREKIIVL